MRIICSLTQLRLLRFCGRNIWGLMKCTDSGKLFRALFSMDVGWDKEEESLMDEEGYQWKSACEPPAWKNGWEPVPRAGSSERPRGRWIPCMAWRGWGMRRTPSGPSGTRCIRRFPLMCSVCWRSCSSRHEIVFMARMIRCDPRDHWQRGRSLVIDCM